MVKNEDMFIRDSIKAIEHFVDELIVIDTGSTDDTVKIARTTGAHVFFQPHLTRTHDYIVPYVGKKDIWVFGVDGDEIYDPDGLNTLRLQIDSGLYDDVYQLQGWYLHADRIDDYGCATGWLGPPSHTPTKLYNMGNIHRWETDGEHILFLCRPFEHNGIKNRAVSSGDGPETWETTPLRCVHTRFLQRSSVENPKTAGRRLNGEDVLGFGNQVDRGGSDVHNNRLMYRKGEKVVKGVYWI